MSLAVVVKRNPYYRVGTWLEGTDDGWQKAKVETKEQKLVVVSATGIILEKRLLAPFIMRPKTVGLDK